MGSVCCGCTRPRPRYAQLVRAVFYPTKEQDSYPQRASALEVYCASNPRRLGDIGDEFVTMMERDVHRQRWEHVLGASSALEGILTRENSELRQFSKVGEIMCREEMPVAVRVAGVRLLTVLVSRCSSDRRSVMKWFGLFQSVQELSLDCSKYARLHGLLNIYNLTASLSSSVATYVHYIVAPLICNISDHRRLEADITVIGDAEEVFLGPVASNSEVSVAEEKAQLLLQPLAAYILSSLGNYIDAAGVRAFAVEFHKLLKKQGIETVVGDGGGDDVSPSGREPLGVILVTFADCLPPGYFGLFVDHFAGLLEVQNASETTQPSSVEGEHHDEFSSLVCFVLGKLLQSRAKPSSPLMSGDSVPSLEPPIPRTSSGGGVQPGWTVSSSRPPAQETIERKLIPKLDHLINTVDDNAMDALFTGMLATMTAGVFLSAIVGEVGSKVLARVVSEVDVGEVRQHDLLVLLGRIREKEIDLSILGNVIPKLDEGQEQEKYVLSFFSSLQPSEEIGTLIRQLFYRFADPVYAFLTRFPKFQEIDGCPEVQGQAATTFVPVALRTPPSRSSASIRAGTFVSISSHSDSRASMIGLLSCTVQPPDVQPSPHSSSPLYQTSSFAASQQSSSTDFHSAVQQRRAFSDEHTKAVQNCLSED